MDSEEIVKKIRTQVLHQVEEAGFFQELSTEQSAWKAGDGKAWSVADCMEHLNLTHRHYFPQLHEIFSREDALFKGSAYKVSWITRKAVRSLTPTGDGEIKWKMKTFRTVTPGADLPIENIRERFYNYLSDYQDFGRKLNAENIGKGKVVSLVGKILTFSPGDCLLFLLAHQARHFQQMRNICAKMPEVPKHG